MVEPTILVLQTNGVKDGTPSFHFNDEYWEGLIKFMDETDQDRTDFYDIAIAAVTHFINCHDVSQKTN